MSIFDTDRSITVESLISLGFFKRAGREDYMLVKILDMGKYKVFYFDIETHEFTDTSKPYHWNDCIKVYDIDDLIIAINT
jgi:hypothetical protein